MEQKSTINLKRYIPKKASKLQFLKIAFYAVVLGFLFYLLYGQIEKEKVKEPVYNEIQNIKIINEDN